MTRTFYLKNKNQLKPGQIIGSLNQMPDSKMSEKYKIVKLLHWSPANSTGEFKVAPVDTAKDPGNLEYNPKFHSSQKNREN